MGRVDHVAESFLAHVCVVLGGREIRVTEQLLDCTEIGTAIEQVGGKGMTQCVRMCGRRSPSIQEAPDIACSHAASFPVQEDRIGR